MWRTLGRWFGWLQLLGLLLSGRALYDAERKIESARLYGNIDAYAYYYVDLIIGTPPQRVSVILDTGSGICAFPCAACSHCGSHIDPAFDFSKSSTASWVSCTNNCQGKCQQGRCSYYQGYTEGSSISGSWFEDYVHLGDSIQHNPAVMGRMGCHNNENNLFYTQKANGIFGVGPLSRGSTLLAQIFHDTAHVQANIMSICFAEWGGRLVIGGYNESYHTGPMKRIPLESGSVYYSVKLKGLYMNGQVLSERMGSAMIDSGTTYTYMGSEPYNALRRAIEDHCAKNNGCGATLSGKCWTLSSGEAGLSRFPTVQTGFGTVMTDWVPQAYLYRRGATNRWCYAFESDGPGASTVLGASWMLHQDIVLDMVAQEVGIVPAKCPEYRERPNHVVLDEAPGTTTTTTTTTHEEATSTTEDSEKSSDGSTATPSTSHSEVPSTTGAPTTATHSPTTTRAATTPSTSTTSTRGAAVAAAAGGAAVAGAAGSSDEGRDGDGGERPEMFSASVRALAGGALVLVSLCGVAWFLRRRCGKQGHKYVKQLDEPSSGMPPQIVGLGDAADSPSGETFVIDDVDQWAEEDGFEFDSKAAGFAFADEAFESNKLIFAGRSPRDASMRDRSLPSSAAFPLGTGHRPGDEALCNSRSAASAAAGSCTDGLGGRAAATISPPTGGLAVGAFAVAGLAGGAGSEVAGGPGFADFSTERVESSGFGRQPSGDALDFADLGGSPSRTIASGPSDRDADFLAGYTSSAAGHAEVEPCGGGASHAGRGAADFSNFGGTRPGTTLDAVLESDFDIGLVGAAPPTFGGAGDDLLGSPSLGEDEGPLD